MIRVNREDSVKNLALGVLLSTLLAACSGGGGAETPEDLARMAFDALKADSFEPFAGAVPTVADLEEMLEDVREKAGEAEYEEGRKWMEGKGGKEAVVANYIEERREEVKETRKALAEAVPAIDWSKAEFGGILEDETKRSERQGIEKVDFYFHIDCGEVKYAVKIDDCFKISRGWVTMDGIRYNESRSEGLTERAR